jgi:CpeT protein
MSASFYRQRLYVIERSEEEEDTVISNVYTLTTPMSSVGACAQDSAPQFDLGAVTIKVGCEVYLKWEEGRSVGGTRGTGCDSNLGDAVYATSEITLEEGLLTSWDRGFTALNQQAWGATEGPYRFVRQAD